MLPVTDSTRMPMGFVKIYGDRLIKSSLWDENPEARLVFLSMLAIADQHGIVDCPNTRVLSRYLNLEAAFLRKGLDVLEAPDPGSRSDEEDGRRVVFEGNHWRLVNYAKYREYRTERQENTRIRVQKHRAKVTGNASNKSVTPVTPVRTEAEAEANTDTETDRVGESVPGIPSTPDTPGTANDWLRYFGTIWAEKRNQLHYGHTGDSKACGALAELLGAWPPGQRAEAWNQRERIVKAYMAETEDRVVKAGHIFAFFVPRFTAILAKPAKRSRNPMPDIGPAPDKWPEREKAGGE